MKTMDFMGTVNVTLGLPIIRTSVDHGTAFDIAYQGKVNIDNAAVAYKYAGRLVQSPNHGGSATSGDSPFGS